MTAAATPPVAASCTLAPLLTWVSHKDRFSDCQNDDLTQTAIQEPQGRRMLDDRVHE